MDPNDMTGGSDHQNPSSIFRFESYPTPYEIQWNPTNPFLTQISPNLSNQTPISNHTPFSNFPNNPDTRQMGNTFLNSTPSTSNVGQVQPFDVNPYIESPASYTFGAPKRSGDVVHFPFQITSGDTGHTEIRCKRKTDSPPLQPVKQHITEEKMAEHMSKLHISSETPGVSETETVKMRRLYMCEEMRKLQTESIIPKSLMQSIERPCTALVLWKPPAARLLPPLAQNQEVDENENTSDGVVVDMVEAINNMEMDNL